MNDDKAREIGERIANARREIQVAMNLASDIGRDGLSNCLAVVRRDLGRTDRELKRLIPPEARKPE